MQLLIGNNHVDVILASETVVRDRQKTVRVGWKINACDGGTLVEHHIKEARILVSKAVVVLTPHSGGNQEV